jgi:hypothetical protein
MNHSPFKELEKKSEGKAEDLRELLLQWAFNVTNQGKAHIVLVINDNAFKNQIFREYPEYRSRLKKIYIEDVGKEEAIAYLTGKLQKLGIEKDVINEGVHHLVQKDEQTNARALFNILTLNRFKKSPAPEEVENEDQEIKQVSLSKEIHEEIVKSVDVIGGRISDLQFLCERLKRGYTIQNAVNIIVEETKRDILSEGFGGTLFVEKTPNEWTQPQLWRTLKLVVKYNSVPYEQLLYGPFEGNDSALDKLITGTDLLTMKKDGTVSSFSPLYQRAFKELVEDVGMIKGMEKTCIKVDVSKNQKYIDDVEAELVRIYDGGIKSDEIEERIHFLNGKMKEFNDKLIAEEKKFQSLPK